MRKGFIPILLILIIISAVIIAGLIYFLKIRPQTNNSNLPSSQPINEAEKSTNTLKPAGPKPLNLSDSDTTIFYADGKILYKYKLEGGLPEKMYQFEDDISRVKLLPLTKDLYIETLKHGPDKNSYNGSDTKFWQFKETSNKPDLLYDLKIGTENKFTGDINHPIITNRLKLTTTSEYIYPESVGSTVNIMSDKLDGTPPKKIGSLKVQYIQGQSPSGTLTQEKYYYPAFIPSYSGEYLLNDVSSFGGGSLGHNAVVVSRDGSKEYAIDFRWFVSSAAWISGDQLLASGQKLYTFKPEGTFTTEDANYLKGEFLQNYISPSKKYLIMNVPPELQLLNIKDKTAKTIDKITNNSNAFVLIGWNLNSDKFLYVPQNKTHLKIYDLKTNKAYTILDSISYDLVAIY